MIQLYKHSELESINSLLFFIYNKFIKNESINLFFYLIFFFFSIIHDYNTKILFTFLFYIYIFFSKNNNKRGLKEEEKNLNIYSVNWE